MACLTKKDVYDIVKKKNNIIKKKIESKISALREEDKSRKQELMENCRGDTYVVNNFERSRIVFNDTLWYKDSDLNCTD